MSLLAGGAGDAGLTIHALLVDPPRPGLALPELVEAGLLEDDAAATLAGAMVRDAAVAVAESGGDLLVNYPPANRAGVDAEAELRDLLEGTLPDPDDVRFEVQVGDSFAARAGNAVTHLLREEEADSVAVIDGRSPTLSRTALDSAAMKLRRSDAVVGPAPDGRVAYLALSEPLDFESAWTPPELRTLVERALDAGHEVDFLPMHPRVDGPGGLISLVALVEARRAAGRLVPPHTAAAIESLNLRVVAEEDGRRVLAGPTDGT